MSIFWIIILSFITLIIRQTLVNIGENEDMSTSGTILFFITAMGYLFFMAFLINVSIYSMFGVTIYYWKILAVLFLYKSIK